MNSIEREKDTRIWQNPDRQYRLLLQVDASGYVRFEKPVEIELDFTQLLDSIGESGIINERSIQVIEIDVNGKMIDESVPFQFDKDENIVNCSNAKGTMIFILKGTSSSSSIRYFHVYFGSDAQFEPLHIQEQITISDTFIHGSQHWRIQSSNATYMFDKTGGAFSEMRDVEGGDWIQFHNTRAPIEYRGIPNIQIFYGEGKFKGIFHPGYGTVKSELVGKGPIKIKIFSTTEVDGRWDCTWEIYPNYAKCTVLNGNKDGFAFLYEGVPGGNDFSPSQDYMVESDGNRTYFLPCDNKLVWARNISPEWVYFGDDQINRTLYYIHHEDDNVQEAMYQVYDALTVFGFGRNAVPGINTYPAHFTIGFCESTDINSISAYIDSAYKELNITKGYAEKYQKHFNDSF